MKKTLRIPCLFLAFFIVLAMGCQEQCLEQYWYEDADGDGLGDRNAKIYGCEQEGYVSNKNDMTPHSKLNIGDRYEGGIIFDVDTSGEHGKVCSIADLGSFNWDDALMVCEASEAGGYTDWYLPSAKEWSQIVYQLKILPRYKLKIGDFGTFNTTSSYWSSTEGSDNQAWCQSFIVETMRFQIYSEWVSSYSAPKHEYKKDTTRQVRAMRVF